MSPDPLDLDVMMIDDNLKRSIPERLRRHTLALQMGQQLRRAVQEQYERIGKPS